MIRFEQVAKQFRRNRVLQGIDLGFGRGDRVALVGSNGAGKTTLIRCLLGEYVCQGKVSVDGRDPRAHREEVLARVGFVPQLPPPLKMPVGQLIRFAASVCGSEPSRMKAMSHRLGLDFDRVRRQPFNRLSGGQKQKILISVALGRDSDILVLDEPAANLDPEARHIFFGLLAERQDKAVMLISSHRLDEVAALVNRVVELDQGKVVLDDRVADAVDMAARMPSPARSVSGASTTPATR
jgi:ABC-2 type transport system ATP-binding protein